MNECGTAVCAYPLLFDGGTVGAEDELLRRGGELGEARDGEVLVVEVGVFAEALLGLVELSGGPRLPNSIYTCLLHHRQHPRLCVVVPISSDAQVDLFFEGVFAVGCH